MPIRARKLIKIQSQHQERHLSDDYLRTVEGEGGEGALLHDHDQGHDADLEVPETKECSALEKEMLKMARKEHDMKMTTMLMKRKVSTILSRTLIRKTCYQQILDSMADLLSADLMQLFQ